MKVIWRAEGGPAALSSRASLLLMHSLSLSLSSSSSLSLTFLSSLPFIFFSPHFCLSTHTPRTDWTFWWCLCVRHGSNEGNQCVWPITCDDRDHIIRLKAGRGGGGMTVCSCPRVNRPISFSFVNTGLTLQTNQCPVRAWPCGSSRNKLLTQH